MRAIKSKIVRAVFAHWNVSNLQISGRFVGLVPEFHHSSVHCVSSELEWVHAQFLITEISRTIRDYPGLSSRDQDNFCRIKRFFRLHARFSFRGFVVAIRSCVCCCAVRQEMVFWCPHHPHLQWRHALRFLRHFARHHADDAFRFPSGQCPCFFCDEPVLLNGYPEHLMAHLKDASTPRHPLPVSLASAASDGPRIVPDTLSPPSPPSSPSPSLRLPLRLPLPSPFPSASKFSASSPSPSPSPSIGITSSQ